jgi:hypothetical protein
MGRRDGVSRPLNLIHDLDHVFFLEAVHEFEGRCTCLLSFGLVDVDLVEHSGTLCVGCI